MFTLISLNVWIGGLLFEQMIEYLQKNRPDFLLLQEVNNGSKKEYPLSYKTFQEIQSKLQYSHAHFAPAFIETLADGEQVVQGNAIFSDFPLTEQAIVYYDVPFGLREEQNPGAFENTPRSLEHVVAHLPQGNLHLLNTQGIWGVDGFDNPRRLHMAEKITAQLQSIGDEPFVLAGDFNVQPQTKTIAKIEHVATNVFSYELVTTFNTKRKDLQKHPGFASAVVDMMFVSDQVVVHSKRCDVVDISDHLPLSIQFELI